MVFFFFNFKFSLIFWSVAVIFSMLPCQTLPHFSCESAFFFFLSGYIFIISKTTWILVLIFQTCKFYRKSFLCGFPASAQLSMILTHISFYVQKDLLKYCYRCLLSNTILLYTGGYAGMMQKSRIKFSGMPCPAISNRLFSVP